MNNPVPPEQVQAQLNAARKEAFTEARFINRLKTVVIVILLLALGGTMAYHAGKTVGMAAAATGARPLDDKEAQRRLLALEGELTLLKADLAPTTEPHPLLATAGSVLKFGEDHSTFVALIGTIIFAGFIYFYFGIDYYFGSYREIADKKRLSEFYRNLGDRMMILNEWEPAEAAYRNALEINPINVEASLGIAKASVFQPLKGQQFVPPYLIEVKIDSLIANNPRPDAQLVFLKGVNQRNQGHEEASRKLFAEAIEIDPEFVGSHIALGYSLMCISDIEKAFVCFQKAFDLDQSYPFANANLGICHLLTLQLDDAVKYFDLSLRGNPDLFSTIGLGDAQRYRGNFREALSLHLYAVNALNRKGIENERYVSGDWLRNFMPLKPGDKVTILRSVQATTFEQKKTIALYALAFDQAIDGDLTAAQKTFSEAMALDQDRTYRLFVENQIQSILNLLQLPAPARAWLEGKLPPPSPPATPA